MTEKLRPLHNVFALEFDRDFTKQGKRGRAFDDLTEVTEPVAQEVIRAFLLSKLSKTAEVKDRIVICGQGDADNSCRHSAPAMKEVSRFQWWVGSSNIDVLASEMCFLGSLRFAMTGERVVAAVHLPTLIVYLTFKKSMGDRKSKEAPPEWESLSGLA